MKNIKRCPKCGLKRNFGKGIRWCQVCEKEDARLRDYYIKKIIERNKINLGDSTIHRVENSEALFKELNSEKIDQDHYQIKQIENKTVLENPHCKPIVIGDGPSISTNDIVKIIEDLPVIDAQKIVENNMAKIPNKPIEEDYKSI